MKKVFGLLLIPALLVSLAACGGTDQPEGPDNPGNNETFEDKLFDGIGAAFDESLGYYNEHPSVIQEGGKRWLYYTRNTVKYDDKTDSIAVREGTLSGGKWTYGEAKTCVTVSASGWDSGNVFGADVVKGSFTYGGEAFSYLMAYSGTDRTDRKDAEIGLAVAKTPAGDWVKVGTKPLLPFDSTEWDNVGLTTYPGNIEASLVSFDKAGKVYLFYEESELFKSNYVCELDCSNLDAIVRGGRKVVETTGVSDLGTSNPLLYGADFIYDEEGESFFALRETRTTATANPVAADTVQLLRASKNVLTQIDQGIATGAPTVWWSKVGDDIDGDATADLTDANKIFGYKRIFSPCIVSDEYGRLSEYGSLDIMFTTQACEGDERLPADRADAYRFSQMIHTLTVTY